MMRILAAVALVLGLATLPLGTAPLAADPDAEIERVIGDQIAAFQRDDLDAAFAHAAPVIQRKFGNPATFGQMVRRGYPMIFRPSRVEWRTLEPLGEGVFVKTVLFEDARGMLFEADYTMGLTDGVWRIRGVELRRLPGMSS